MTTYPVPLERRLADMLATMQRRVTLLESRSVVAPSTSSSGLQTTGGTMTGTLVLSAVNPLQVTTTSPGAGKVLVSDANGNASWGAAGSVAAPLTLSSGQASSSILTVTNTTSSPSIAALVVTSQTAGDRSVGIQVAGDTNRRLMVDSNGVHSWGPGNAAADTNLYRSAAGTLKTDNNLTVNGNLTVGGIGKTLYVSKPANTSMTSNVTLTNDPDLTVSLAANATYLMASTLKYEADAAGDLNVSWVGPAGATSVGTLVALLVSATSDANVYINNYSLGGSFGIGGRGAGSSRAAFFNGVVTTGATAGPLTLQWAQFTADAIATILYAGSYLSLQRIA